MPETRRSIVQRAGTFARFVRQQRAKLSQLKAEARDPDPGAPFLLTGGEKDWLRTGFRVRRGERFKLVAGGQHWLAKGLGLMFEPDATLFVRIDGGPVRRIGDSEWIFEAWDDGELELISKGLSEFANENGALIAAKRPAMKPGISVRIERSDAPASGNGAPEGWNYLWRIGQAQIFTGSRDDVEVKMGGDVGILQFPVEQPLTPESSLEWDWLIESLPSRLPEDLAFTHDYISIAVEFENGRDLTYMWSAGLPEGHVFRCPLGWWCDWETHWVLRSGEAGLGDWHSEKRMIAADYREALGEPLPEWIVRVWLIANSVFQRNEARARFRNFRIE